MLKLQTISDDYFNLLLWLQWFSMIRSIIKSTLRILLPQSAFRIISDLNQRLNSEKLDFANDYINYFIEKKGIEIGGPSNLFKYSLPIYERVHSLDGVNFSNATYWEGQIQHGNTYKYYKDKVGYQYISDGTDLSKINDGSYDFLVSSNCLEHIANPLKAISEWHRVLKDDGILLLVLPNKISNFDNKRPFTTFEHLLEDYNDQTREDDLTHLKEILELHDLKMDLPAGNIENFKKRSLDNFQHRYLHHHVFNLPLMEKMMKWIDFETILKNETFENFYILAKKI